PRLALCNRWRRGFLRLELYRARPETDSDCEHRGCEEKQFCSHRPILWLSPLESEKLINQFLLYLLRCVYRTLGLQQWFACRGYLKNRPPDERRPIDLTNLRNSPLV